MVILWMGAGVEVGLLVQRTVARPVQDSAASSMDVRRTGIRPPYELRTAGCLRGIWEAPRSDPATSLARPLPLPA